MLDNSNGRGRDIVPLWEKYTQTVNEAADYFNIGDKKLRKIIDDDKDAKFILWNGNRSLIKRHLFEKYIDDANVI